MIGPGELCLAWVHAGTVRAEFLDSVLGLLAESATARLVSRWCSFSAGVHVAAARNEVTAGFLSGGPEPWLLMFDTDMRFDPALVLRLARASSATARPVVSGVYWQPDPGGPPVPMVYQRRPGSPHFDPLGSVPPSRVIRVDGCGAGCLLIHRRVFESIGKAEDGAPAWWSELPVPGHPGSVYGEDLSFCIRAAAAGFPIHADTGAQPGHVKTVTVTGPA